MSMGLVMEVAAVALLKAARGRRARKKGEQGNAPPLKSHWRCGGQVGSKRMGIAFVELEKTAMGTGASAAGVLISLVSGLRSCIIMLRPSVVNQKEGKNRSFVGVSTSERLHVPLLVL